MEIRKLNALRGIAAMIVVVSHCSNSGLLPKALGAGAGQLGVMLFFILSGFLMSYLYLDKRCDPENLRYFVVARVGRVIPLFFLVVLSSYALMKLGKNDLLYDVRDAASLISHLMFLSGDSVLWTIAPEIQFYALFVFLWWLSARCRHGLYLFISAAIILVLLLGFPNPSREVFGLTVDTKLIRSLPYFLAGVILGQLYRRWKPPLRLISGAFVSAILVIPLLYPEIFRALMGHGHGMWGDVKILLVVSLIFFVVVFFVPDENKILANPVGDYVGRISYSLYLLHMPILRVVMKLMPANLPSLIYVLAFLVATGIVASVSYSVFESPARTMIKAKLLPSGTSRGREDRRAQP